MSTRLPTATTTLSHTHLFSHHLWEGEVGDEVSDSGEDGALGGGVEAAVHEALDVLRHVQ